MGCMMYLDIKYNYVSPSLFTGKHLLIFQIFSFYLDNSTHVNFRSSRHYLIFAMKCFINIVFYLPVNLIFFIKASSGSKYFL